MPTISAAASAPAGQSSQSGTRLSGGEGDEPDEVLPLAAGAGAGEPIPVAPVPKGVATLAARDAGDPDGAKADAAEPDPAGAAVAAEPVLVAAGAASRRLSSKARRDGSIMG